MRFLPVLLAMLLSTAAGAAPAAAGIDPGVLDHVLLWGRGIDQVSAVMAVKLGFQVVPGRNPGGVANRYVRMADGSYIELLGITRPDAQMDPGMLADQASLHGAPGSRSFGLRTSTLDVRRTQLAARGLSPTPVFSAAANDPDGDGAGHPPRWRLFAFTTPPLSSTLFFIDYAVLEPTPARVAATRAAHVHSNGARSITAFWLLSANAETERGRLARMGFTAATPMRFPQVGARGYCVAVGDKQLLALQPDGTGMAADALRAGGPQVFGVSVAVDDLAAARHRVARGYETTLATYDGPAGRAFLAPTGDDLGMLVEFHGPSSRAACAAR